MKHKGKWFLLSFLLAVVTSYLLLQMLKTRAAQDVTAAPKVQVVVATAVVEDHEKIPPTALKLQAVNPDSIPPDAIRSLHDAVDAVTLQRIVPGEVLQKSMLANSQQAASLFAMKIPKGMRAVSIADSDVIGVGGLLAPGDHVDVVVGMKKDESNGKSDMAKMTMQDVTVLAVGSQSHLADNVPPSSGSQTSNTANTSNSTPKASTVTLAVTPDQAEALVYADLYGTIRLALRGVDDPEQVSTNGVSGDNALMMRK